MSAATPPVERELVVMGQVLAPYGVQGWVKVAPFTEAQATLLDHRRWWLGREREPASTWQEFEVLSGRAHGDALIVQFVGLVDRDQAFALKGLAVGLPRSHLPSPGKDEVYWSDLVGLAVVNEADEALGEVAEVFSNGSHPVLRVTDGTAERLIPFVAAYVKETDVDGRRIRVAWDRSW